MTSYPARHVQHAYPGNYPLDVQNASYDRNRDTELLNLDGVMCNEPPRRKHFDWCIASVLGYMCCPCIGFCAMYYSMRANHGHDHNIQEYKIRSSSTKAKVLTLLSIIIGSLCIIAIIIVIVVTTNNDKNPYMDINRNSYN